LSYFELNDFIVDVFEGPLTDLANFIGLGEEPESRFMLFKSPPMEVKELFGKGMGKNFIPAGRPDKCQL
jgi:hypothetical protein